MIVVVASFMLLAYYRGLNNTSAWIVLTSCPSIHVIHFVLPSGDIDRTLNYPCNVLSSPYKKGGFMEGEVMLRS